jgi:methionyl-tRNA formyltransferase
VRTVYFGTSDFAATVLERLVDSPHRPVLVVTRPDRPQGRGRKLAPPPVAVRAGELGLDVIQPERLHAPEAIKRIDAAEADALCVCAYGVLIGEPLLSRGILNVHPSLLPRWRGAAPIERAIMAGDHRTGVTIMRLAAQLDAGPIALQGAEPIHADDDYASLAGRLERLGGDLLVRALDEQPPFCDQSEDGVTYAHKIEASDRALDPGTTPECNDRKVRALRPHIGARLELGDGSFMGVIRARVATGPLPPDVPPGRVHQDGERLLFECARGSLELQEILPPGSRPMSAADWIRGHPGLVLEVPAD